MTKAAKWTAGILLGVVLLIGSAAAVRWTFARSMAEQQLTSLIGRQVSIGSISEAWLAARGLVSRIHRKKLPGRPMAARTRRPNARKSAVRSAVEHVFARQKGPMGLVVRTIGIARAQVKIGLANLAYNLKRLVWLTSRLAPA